MGPQNCGRKKRLFFRISATRYHRGQSYYKTTLYEENVLEQLICKNYKRITLQKAKFLACFLQKGHASGSNITKKIFWWNYFCNNYNFLQNRYSKELFCNYFGQDGGEFWLAGPRGTEFSEFGSEKKIDSLCDLIQCSYNDWGSRPPTPQVDPHSYPSNALKTLTSLNKESKPFFQGSSMWSFPSFLPLAITTFGGPEACFSLAIIELGAFEFIVPKYYYRLGEIELTSLDSII